MKEDDLRLLRELDRRGERDNYVRMFAVSLYRNEGYDIERIARCVCQSPETVTDWLCRYHKNGLAGWADLDEHPMAAIEKSLRDQSIKL